MLSVTIPGKPLPLKRHRHVKGITYNPHRKEMNYYSFMAKLLTNKNKSLPFDKAIKAQITFFMPIPKRSKSIKEGQYHSKRLDIDNLLKFALDALNGILWKDDSLICDIASSKRYSKNPRTVINITVL